MNVPTAMAEVTPIARARRPCHAPRNIAIAPDATPRSSRCRGRCRDVVTATSSPKSRPTTTTETHSTRPRPSAVRAIAANFCRTIVPRGIGVTTRRSTSLLLLPGEAPRPAPIANTRIEAGRGTRTARSGDSQAGVPRLSSPMALRGHRGGCPGRTRTVGVVTLGWKELYISTIAERPIPHREALSAGHGAPSARDRWTTLPRLWGSTRGTAPRDPVRGSGGRRLRTGQPP